MKLAPTDSWRNDARPVRALKSQKWVGVSAARPSSRSLSSAVSACGSKGVQSQLSTSSQIVLYETLRFPW